MAGVFETAKSLGLRDVAANVCGYDINSHGTMPCPIHKEQNGKSFSVRDDTFWKCFGKCDKHGDVIELVAVAKGLSQLEAAKLICETYGLVYDEPEKKNDLPEIDYSFLLGNKKFADYAHHYLKTNAKVLHYLREVRKFTDETIAKYQWGFLTREQYDMLAPLVSKGEASMENYKAFSRHIGRLIIPLHNASGKQVLGFVSRSLSVNDKIKYINDSDSAEKYGYHKKVYSYGVSNSKKHTPVTIVEGYLDGPSLSQMGYNTIAMGDCSLPEPRFNYLVKMYSKLILALDNDTTGVWRTLELYKKYKHINFGFVLWPKNIKDANDALINSVELKYGDYYEYINSVWENNINEIRDDYSKRIDFVERLRDSLSFTTYGSENYFVRVEIDKFIESILDA